MITSEETVTIKRPIEEVFDYISNLQNGPEWQSGLAEVRCISDGPIGVGTHFTSVRKFMGRELEAEIEFTEYELEKKIVLKSVSGSTPFEQTILFESTPEGTRVSSSLKLEMGGFMGLAEPLIASSVKREAESDINRLKEKLESQIPQPFELLE